jgi:hypothetical protein
MGAGLLLNYTSRVDAFQFLEFVTVDVDAFLHITHLRQLQLRPALRPNASSLSPLRSQQLLLQILEQLGQVDVSLLLFADLLPHRTLLLHI